MKEGVKAEVKTVYKLVWPGAAIVYGGSGENEYSLEQDAISAAKAFKENPRTKNPKMTDENVAYWKRQPIRIIRMITNLELICVV